MIGVMLLAQWLTAAYACPMGARALAPAGESVASHAPMADCHGMTPAVMDPVNPSLCKAHCEADRQAPAHWTPDEAPAAGPGWFIVAAVGRLEGAGSQAGHPEVPRSGAPPGWPPLYLIHQVLRN